jgi:hypothetical protein
MDLLAAEQANGKAWNRAKLGAFLCFAIAGALWVASLCVAPPANITAAGTISIGATDR